MFGMLKYKSEFECKPICNVMSASCLLSVVFNISEQELRHQIITIRESIKLNLVLEILRIVKHHLKFSNRCPTFCIYNEFGSVLLSDSEKVITTKCNKYRLDSFTQIKLCVAESLSFAVSRGM